MFFLLKRNRVCAQLCFIYCVSYRHGCCLPTFTTVCYFPSSLQKKCTEISEMHPYRHLHWLWNRRGTECSYFLSRHGCLTSPALRSQWVFGPADTQVGVVESATCCIWIPSVLCFMKLDEMPRGKKWLRNSFKKRKPVFLSGEETFFFFLAWRKKSHPTLPRGSSARRTHCLSDNGDVTRTFISCTVCPHAYITLLISACPIFVLINFLWIKDKNSTARFS